MILEFEYIWMNLNDKFKLEWQTEAIFELEWQISMFECQISAN
jgi:hypothetical protein